MTQDITHPDKLNLVNLVSSGALRTCKKLLNLTSIPSMSTATMGENTNQILMQQVKSQTYANHKAKPWRLQLPTCRPLSAHEDQRYIATDLGRSRFVGETKSC